MDKTTDSNIKRYLSAASTENPGIVAVYLFGSYAKGKPDENSDIDLLIVINDLKDNEKFDIQVQLMLLAVGYDDRIEPHPLSAKDFDSFSPLVSEVKKTGIQLNIS